jgi:hypothetical protein
MRTLDEQLQNKIRQITQTQLSTRSHVRHWDDLILVTKKFPV